MMKLPERASTIYGYLMFSALFCALLPIQRSHMPSWADTVICALLYPDDYVCSSHGLEIVFWLAWLAMIVLYRRHRLQFVGVTVLLYYLYYKIALFWILGVWFL